jgi:hypothetical protein
MSEKKNDRLAKAGAIAGGTALSGAYYKAARDHQILAGYDKARVKYNKSVKEKYPTQNPQEKILDPQDVSGKRRKARLDWERKQAKKHGVVRSEYDSTSKRFPTERGKLVLDKKGNPITIKDGRGGERLKTKRSGVSKVLQKVFKGSKAAMPKWAIINNPYAKYLR